MSDAYKCDRCGEYTDEKQTVGKVSGNGILNKTIVGDSSDLCESCEAAFEEFLDESLTDHPLDDVLHTTDTFGCGWVWTPQDWGTPEWSVEDSSTVLEEQVESGARNY